MPEGGWQHWLDEVSTSAAGYRKDYEVCAGRTASSSKEAVDLFCAAEPTSWAAISRAGRPPLETPPLHSRTR